MAHQLTTRADGKVEFAYLAKDGLPWHGLGQAVPDNASIDDWKIAAGMDWKIQRGVVRYNIDREGRQLSMPDQHVLFRSDSKRPLGVVSEGYKVVQPGEVIEFFREIAQVGGLEMSAAGTIFDGKRFWATAKIGDASPLGLQDKVGGFLLISTSADGSMATEVRRTTVRVVCNNTEQEEATDEIEIDYDGDTVEIGFNISYLIDALTNMEQEMVKIEVTDSNSSALITIPEDNNFKYVVMPMRI